ncbi:MAG: helix-turn-helix domain-containing protein [Saprospiraceae bacterium]|nr:helix-turn-helix domain-containing protein [Saprospiraceae bacterium]
MAATQQQRIIFGLKVKQFRQERAWNFEELSQRTGISISYLNEIEKGKKYPLLDYRKRLAEVLEVPYDFLISPELTKEFAPLGELLHSKFLNDLPLDLFGIGMQPLVEIIASDPAKVNAFISALLEIARVYALREEHFYFAALRAYQELRNNYFEEIEQAATDFVREHQLPKNGGVSLTMLTDILEKQHGCTVVPDGLDAYEPLHWLRSVFNPHTKRILLNGQLNEHQRSYQLAKELGFNELRLKERPWASNFLRVNSFEEVLNNYKAAYFAVAILVNRESFVTDIGEFFAQENWKENGLRDLMAKYQASPEVLFQRFNVLTKDFGLDKVFFQRVIHDLERDAFEMDKELHLNRRHQPHATGLGEHYCRRWLSISLLRDLKTKQIETGNPNLQRIGILRAVFVATDEEYLCIAIAKPGHPTPGRNVSVTLGVLLDDHTKQRIRFWDDPAIPRRRVNVTCQRCALYDCLERAAPPKVVLRREERKRMEELLRQLTGI